MPFQRKLKPTEACGIYNTEKICDVMLELCQVKCIYVAH